MLTVLRGVCIESEHISRGCTCTACNVSTSILCVYVSDQL